MIKVRRFNPVDYMTSDEEIIEFLVDSFKDDPTGATYQGALKFVADACGMRKTLSLNCLVIKILLNEPREVAQPLVEKPAPMRLQHAY